MTLDISTALRGGFRRTFTPAGLSLAVVFVLVGIASAVASQTLLADVFDSLIEIMRSQQGPGDDEFTRQEIRMTASLLRGRTPLALPIPLSVAGLLFVLSAVFAEVARLVTARVAFDEGGADAGGGRLRRNLGRATLNGIVGGIVVDVVIVLGGIVGLVGIVIGGVVVALFLAMSFLFLRQEIAIEDKNFVDAMTDSWTLAKGNRLELFTLVFVVVIAVGVVSAILTAVFGVVDPTVGVAVGLLVGGLTAVFGTAVVTRAYAQLHAERAANMGQSDPDEWAIQH